MYLDVNGAKVELDEEGFLVNPNDWNEAVRVALIRQHEADGHIAVSDTAAGLIDYFREYYSENKTHPTMHQLVQTLGAHQGEHFHDHEAYKEFLYELFPHGPIQMLCKLAGLPKPIEQNAA
jgi:TusE/DsrC/DsvC family sulfur relay protein